jgi:hypothetical protein
MLGVPQFGDVRVISNTGIVGSATPGTTVTSGAANTYGSVTELISAANNVQESWGIAITVFDTGASATTTATAIDILIGGATDDVLISSLLCGWVYGGASRTYFFPLHIPAGARLAARLSSEVASNPAIVLCHLYGGGPPPFKVGSRVTTYGSKNNNSRGQTVSPTVSGGTASVTQFTASSSFDEFFFLPGFEPYNDTTIQQRYYNIGIGVGSSTEERIGTWWYGFDAGEKSSGPVPGMGAFNRAPAGSRLTMLASNSGTNDSTYGGLIYAVS